MASGGSRNRSGPKKQEGSGRSDRAGYSLTALPAEGFTGTPPEFPLPTRIVWYEYFTGEGRSREKVRENDTAATEQVRDRELELWAWLWTTPQACAWSMLSEAWRLNTIAMYVRTFVICEGSEATAADKNSLHRFADQIGMTTAGLAEMGWKIASTKAAETEVADSQASQPTEATGTDGVVTPFERRR